MDFQDWILRKLLVKYEKSKSFTDKNVSKKIAFKLYDEGEINYMLENADLKAEFLCAVYTLKNEGYIDFSWQKFEENNLVDRIWLITEEDKLDKAYDFIGLKQKRDLLDQLLLYLKGYADKIHNLKWISDFLDEMIFYISDKNRIPRFFNNNIINTDILKALEYIDKHANDEIQERVLSINCYGDSKYFERSIRSKIVSIIKYSEKQDIVCDFQNRSFTEDELLMKAGIVKRPEIIEFCGKITVQLKNKSIIDYSGQVFGSYINSVTINEIKTVTGMNINQVIFIENLTNYLWYIKNIKSESELVLFHGGFYSPAKGLWFKKIYDGLKEKKVKFLHWSDIDVGGFRIFCRLRDNIVPELETYYMDINIYDLHKNSGSLFDESYRRILENMLKDPVYDVFYELITQMIKIGKKIEQEVFIEFLQ